MKTMTCIICPRGCSLTVEKEGAEYKVTGQMCKRGKEFAVNELTNPTRSVTTTVRTVFTEFPRLPVKTDGEVPLGKIFDVMKELDCILVKDTVKSGDVIVENISNTGINIVATISMSLMMGVS